MKNTFILFTFVLAFVACQQKNESTKVLEPKPVNKIIGTWKMVYADIQEVDSLQIKDLSKSEFVKIINKTHFSFFNQGYTDPSLFYGGGGTYKLENNTYTEKLHFTSVDAIRDHEFPFTIEFKKDTLIQYGLEEVESANTKRYILEKYIRIK